MTTPAPQRRFVPVFEAVEDAPTLARLVHLARQSREMLEAVGFLIPGPLRSAVHAGPLEGASWCLLVDNNAAAAKLRQVLPALTAELHNQGAQINAIRLKVQLTRR